MAAFFATGLAPQAHVPGFSHGPMGFPSGDSYLYGSWHIVDCSETTHCSEPLDTIYGVAEFMGLWESCTELASEYPLTCSTGANPAEQCDDLGENASGEFQLTTELNGGGSGKQKMSSTLETCGSVGGGGGEPN